MVVRDRTAGPSRTAPSTTGWNRFVSVLLGVGLVLASGCGSNAVFLHPDAELGFYETVGVLPFANLGADRLAGEKFSSVFTAHLMVSQKFNVAEPGQFLAAYKKHGGGSGSAPIGLPLEDLRALQEEAKVQGVFEGTVREYDFTRGSSPRPMISVEVRLVDTATGTVVWSSSETRTGRPAIPLLNIGGPRTLSELAEVVAALLVDRLP